MDRAPQAEGRIARIRRRAVKAVRRLFDLTFDPRLSRSYWPEGPRKSKGRIFLELLWWFVRYGEINAYYYVYGLDLKFAARAREVLPYRVFRRIRNQRNLRPDQPFNYVCLLRDKWLFSQLAASVGVAAPKAFALLDARGVLWFDSDRTAPLDSLQAAEAPALDGFCKKLAGIQGEGAFSLRTDRGRLFMNGVEASLERLRARLDDSYLFQERIEQHSMLRALHPASLNTLRLITFCQDGEAVLFCAALRVGAGGKPVDNWAAGGLIVGVDTEQGRLRGEGYFKPGYGGRTSVHPDSGVRFEGFEIPYFREAVDLVLRMHRRLSTIHSVGWDVGVAPDGPVLIEGNDDWEGGIPMVLEKDFRRRFLAMYAPRGDAGVCSNGVTASEARLRPGRHAIP
ncbi:MAG: sugar-transfer associated ATP-grasp domain-containing protein [Steroidobacteraceae bacterium]|jgi:hypothetical protein|nr:sugar-transfer associated ATP-grasp domain-containing protein [Steroidobacteraceae bacterium]